MAVFPAELEDVLQSLQRQIDEINTARPGPTSYGPGDGHLRFYTSTGDTFHVASSGAQVKHRGALTGLTPHLEANTSKQEQQDATLGTHGTRLGGHDSDISGLRTSKADVTYVDTKASTATVNSIRDDLQNQLNGKAAVTYVDTKASQSALNSTNSRVSTLESQMSGKAAVSYVDAVDSRARAAQARADSAYALAAGRASDGDVSNALATAKQYTDSRIRALVLALQDRGIPIAL